MADPQGFNAYSYSRNNPMVLLDPNGEFWNPFSSITASWFVSLGNIANSYANYDPVFNYATNHVGVAYTFGAVLWTISLRRMRERGDSRTKG